MKEFYDIVIVGVGGVGMVVVIEVKDVGLNLVIFEKMFVVGGNMFKLLSGMNVFEIKF